MIVHKSAVGLVAAACLAWPVQAPAQRIAEGFHYDPPTETRLDDKAARAKLLSWTQMKPGSRTMQWFMRNTSSETIEITTYEFSECLNVLGVKCDEELKGPRIEPGETVVLATIRQRNIEQRWFYRTLFQARFLGSRASPELKKTGRAVEPAVARRTTGWIPERYEYVDRVMPMLMRNHSVPGVAIVLIEGPMVQWSASYGVAESGGEEVTTRTVFRVADLAEPVIALALHRLSEVRAWNVESPVTTWAHEETIPQGLEDISAADILSHSDRTVATGYAWLQHLVETSEGHDLEVLIRAMVLDPHHLTSMNFVPLASGGMARGHDRSGQPLPPLPVDAADASGSLFSSASDYARFLVETSPLSRRDPATWLRLVRPHRPVDEGSDLAWGLGWLVAEATDGSPIVFRAGSTSGYTSFAMVDETRQRALVILTNGDGGLDLTEDVLGFLDPWSDPIVEAYLDLDD